jgi:hypothetical protein
MTTIAHLIKTLILAVIASEAKQFRLCVASAGLPRCARNDGKAAFRVMRTSTKYMCFIGLTLLLIQQPVVAQSSSGNKEIQYPGEHDLRPLSDWTPKEQRFNCKIIDQNGNNGDFEILLSGGRPFPQKLEDFSRKTFNRFRLSRTLQLATIRQDSIGLLSKWPRSVEISNYGNENSVYNGSVTFSDPKIAFRNAVRIDSTDISKNKTYSGKMSVEIALSDVSEQEQREKMQQNGVPSYSRDFLLQNDPSYWRKIGVGFCDVIATAQRPVTLDEARNFKR